ncbi:MAG: Ig-like domain-containing protein [Actinomycetota bacterium]|nr:Ig-like domain-containing protein [Actinomycetota bacterium]
MVAAITVAATTVALTAGFGLLEASAVAAATAEASGTWGLARSLPGLGAFSAVLAVSCPASGYCEAAGIYKPSQGGSAPFVVSERNGVWGTPQAIPGLAALNVGLLADVAGLSCATPGNCAVSGSYADASFHSRAFVADEHAGTWGQAIQVPGTAALDTGHYATSTALSCSAPGDCAMSGQYFDGGEVTRVFVADEVNGTWHDAIELPGTLILGDAQADTLSCAAPGECVVGGGYGAVSHDQAYVASEVNGTWHDAIELPGTAVLNAGDDAVVSTVSCPAPGTCTAAGTYTDQASNDQAFVASEVNGTWQDAIELPGTATLNAGGNTYLQSVSCPAPGTCAAGGSYLDAGGHEQAFVASEVNGTWQDAIEVPGTAALNVGENAIVESVSCSAPGTCAAGGGYSSAPKFGQAFVASEVNGTWQDAITVPGTAALNAGGGAVVVALSCAPGGTCAAGGLYGYQPNKPRAFVASQTQAGGTATSLRLSARTTRAGHEHTERLTVTVSPGTPYGLAIVTAIAGPGRSARLCLITVRAGTGTCHLTNSALPAGTYQVTARFLGGNTLTPSASPAQTLHVEAAHARRPGPRH